MAKIEQRNKFAVGENIEVMGPNFKLFEHSIDEIYNEGMEPVESAPHARQIVFMKMDTDVNPHDILRRKKAR